MHGIGRHVKNLPARFLRWRRAKERKMNRIELISEFAEAPERGHFTNALGQAAIMDGQQSSP